MVYFWFLYAKKNQFVVWIEVDFHILTIILVILDGAYHINKKTLIFNNKLLFSQLVAS